MEEEKADVEEATQPLLSEENSSNSPPTPGDSEAEQLLKFDNFASAQYRLGKFTEAEELLQKAYEIRERKLGIEHPDTLVTLNNLAAARGRSGKLDLAEDDFKKTLERRTAKLGPKHIDSLITMNHLGVLYKQKGQLALAKENLEVALEGFTETLGEIHLCAAETAYNYAVLLVQLGYRRKAGRMFNKAQTGLAAKLGATHQNTLDAMEWELRCTASTDREAKILEDEGKDPIEAIYQTKKDWKIQKECDNCRSSYTMLRREHHCRVCCRSVCHDCSIKTTMVVEFDPKNPVRCCMTCEQQGFCC